MKTSRGQQDPLTHPLCALYTLTTELGNALIFLNVKVKDSFKVFFVLEVSQFGLNHRPVDDISSGQLCILSGER